MKSSSRNYAWVPLLCSGTWCITLLVLIITWAGQGKPHYVSQDGSFPYISDIGADILKPFFIIGCIITGLSLIGTLVAERLLRHEGRLTHDKKVRQKTLAILAIIGSVIGAAGLVLLSGFDTKRYTSLHRVFLGIFMLGVALSAIFTVAEYFSLTHHNGHIGGLRWSAMLKGFVAFILIALSVALGVCLSQDNLGNVGAALEWTIGFGFVFYPLTFWLDLRQAQPKGRTMSRMEMARSQPNGHTQMTPVEPR